MDEEEDLLTKVSKEGRTIQFKSQPLNDPDLNVLDLFFFLSIQSLQHQQSWKNLNRVYIFH